MRARSIAISPRSFSARSAAVACSARGRKRFLDLVLEVAGTLDLNRDAGKLQLGAMAARLESGRGRPPPRSARGAPRASTRGIASTLPRPMIECMPWPTRGRRGISMRSSGAPGAVEAILASKPEERRALIEEAAGLGRFKARRHRAELKLSRVAFRSSVPATSRTRSRTLAPPCAAGDGRGARREAARRDRDAARAHRRARSCNARRAARRRRQPPCRRCARTPRRRGEAGGRPRGARPRGGRARRCGGQAASRPCRCCTGCGALPSGSASGASRRRRCSSRFRVELADVSSDAGDPGVETAELERAALDAGEAARVAAVEREARARARTPGAHTAARRGERIASRRAGEARRVARRARQHRGGADGRRG